MEHQESTRLQSDAGIFSHFVVKPCKRGAIILATSQGKVQMNPPFDSFSSKHKIQTKVVKALSKTVRKWLVGFGAIDYNF